MTNDDSQKHKFRLRDLAKDLRLWVGIMSGLAGAFGAILLEGRRLLHAPDVADRANDTAQEALRISARNNRLIEDIREEFLDYREDIRIVFCTQENWLSPQAEARLECWRIQSGNRRTRPIKPGSNGSQ